MQATQTNTLSLITLAAALAACGSSQSSRSAYAYTGVDPITNANVNIGTTVMPDGESFTGAYHSQEIGDVNLQQSGDTLVGSYEYDRASCHARGHIEGTVEGNLARFRWTEDQRQCGILSVPPGRGFFLFWRDNVHNARVTGQWGYGDNETGGGRWSLFRLPNRSRATQSTGTPSSGGDNGGSGSGSSGGDPLQGL